MKLVVGLGNPGRKYEKTRHNVGFMVAARLAALTAAGPPRARFEGEAVEGIAGRGDKTEKLVILCPHTYMNASGKSVRKACDFYKLAPEDVLVICDDLNLPSGRLRIRARGSAGGQKGLADIIRHLGTDDFPRLRIGIDPPPTGWDAADYVLGKFAGEEKDKIEDSITRAAHAAIDWATEGIGSVMNRYNADPNKPPRKPKKTKTSKASKDARRVDDQSHNDSQNDSHNPSKSASGDIAGNAE